MEAFRRQTRVDPNQIRSMRHGMYHQYESLAQALRRLGPRGASAVDYFDLEPLRILERYDSEEDGSTKFVFQAADGARFETVLLRAKTARTTVCLSTQVGCKAGCPFCATSRMGLVRNLTAAELIEQVLIAGRIAREEGRRLRNIVLMGMGEPLHNEDAVHQALATFLSREFCAIPPRRITVSTVGVPDAMLRLVDRFPAIQLALSLHSARPEVRARMVPSSRGYPWELLRETLGECNRRQIRHREQGPVMIEYVMLEGVNDGDQDLEALIEYLRGIPAHVNLIPYNAIPSASLWKPTPKVRRDAFARGLRSAGIFTTIRFSMGQDVQAACGQLVQKLP